MAGSTRPWGYRRGRRMLVLRPVDASTAADIAVGDFVVEVTAGYCGSGASGGLPIGVACQAAATPSADGDVSILIDVSEDSIYEYPADTGTVTQGLCGRTVDIGGAQSIAIAASTDDIVRVHEINADRNSCFVSIIPTNATLA